MRFRLLLLASTMFVLPSVASGATIDFISATGARVSSGLGAGWQYGEPTAADQLLITYNVDLSNDQQVGNMSTAEMLSDDSVFGDTLGLHHDFTLGGRFNASYHRSLTAGASGFWLPDEWPGKGHDQVTGTPEPATLLLLATGFAGLAIRRRKQSQS